MGYVTDKSFLKIPSGEGKGQPFQPMPWQRSFFKAVQDPDGPATILLTLPRGNAKTTTCALLLAFLMVHGEAEANHYVVAPRVKQAGTLFEQMRRSLARSAGPTRTPATLQSPARPPGIAARQAGGQGACRVRLPAGPRSSGRRRVRLGCPLWRVSCSSDHLHFVTN